MSQTVAGRVMPMIIVDSVDKAWNFYVDTLGVSHVIGMVGRLEAAHNAFDEACRQLASRGERMRTTTFGTVGVEDYVRFMELHTRHHARQMADRH